MLLFPSLLLILILFLMKRKDPLLDMSLVRFQLPCKRLFKVFIWDLGKFYLITGNDQESVAVALFQWLHSVGLSSQIQFIETYECDDVLSCSKLYYTSLPDNTLF